MGIRNKISCTCDLSHKCFLRVFLGPVFNFADNGEDVVVYMSGILMPKPFVLIQAVVDDGASLFALPFDKDKGIRFVGGVVEGRIVVFVRLLENIKGMIVVYDERAVCRFDGKKEKFACVWDARGACTFVENGAFVTECKESGIMQTQTRIAPNGSELFKIA